MRDLLISINDHFLLEPYASLLNGMIWGIPLKTSHTLYVALQKTGVLHMVVLSGSNVNFIISYCFALTSMFGKRVSTLISILILIIFITLVPFQAPVIRAFIMGVLTLVAFMFGRQVLVIYSLFLTGLVMIIFDSSLISSVSFQLSFAATLGVIVASKVKVQSQSKYIHLLVENIKVSMAAQLFTFPIIMVHFKQISIIAPITNLLVGWTMEPILIFGFLADLLGLLWRPFSYIPLSICQGILIYFVSVVYLLEKIPFGFIDLSSLKVFGP